MQQNGLWQAVLGEIEVSVSHPNFVTWFKKTQLVQCTDQQVVIGVANIFVKQQLEHKYGDLIRETLQNSGVTPDEIIYKIIPMKKSDDDQSDDQPVLVNRSVKPNDNTTTTPRATPSNSLSHSYRQGINERYTFDNFIVGASNELAFAACQAVAQTPGSRYNPLFLYGGVGIGKTHLIQAAGNAFLSQNPKAKVLYISTEQFVQEFVDAIRFRKTAEFASHYRSADMLIVDDVQFIAGKDKMEEEFFHTFNALHQANKQIIISSDRPPKDIATIQDRLRSRFAWGMSIDMQIPDFETRCAIVQTKAQDNGVTLPTDVMEYLANIQSNIRELEGALNQVLAFCEMRSIPPTMAVVTNLLGAAKTRPKHISAKQIVERTARHFHVSVEDIMGPKRDKDIVVPRQIAMYLLRSELKLSLPKIARELGRKDHTTAMHSVTKVADELVADASLRTAIDEIKERLYA